MVGKWSKEYRYSLDLTGFRWIMLQYIAPIMKEESMNLEMWIKVKQFLNKQRNWASRNTGLASMTLTSRAGKYSKQMDIEQWLGSCAMTNPVLRVHDRVFI